jgi:hypothetical protein
LQACIAGRVLRQSEPACAFSIKVMRRRIAL